MRIREAIIVLSAGGLVAAACEDKRAPAPAQPPESTPAQTASAAPAEVETPTVPAHMAEHFTRGAKMRDAVIAGDLSALRKDAQWMAEHELTKSFPKDWKPHVDRMQNAAKRALDAQTLEDAAQGVAATAASCGGCHAALGGPKLEIGKPPAEGSGVGPHMQRHQWAAEWMWNALSTPSEDAWIAASEAMADAPLVPKAVAGERSVDKKVEKLATDVHAIAEKSRTSRDMDQWQKAYADLLVTCADCHQAAGAKPGAR